MNAVNRDFKIIIEFWIEFTIKMLIRRIAFVANSKHANTIL